MLVEICSVHPEHHSLKVHWWATTPLAYSKQQFFQLMAFAPAMDKVQIKTVSAPVWHLHVLKCRDCKILQSFEFDILTC